MARIDASDSHWVNWTQYHHIRFYFAEPVNERVPSNLGVVFSKGVVYGNAEGINPDKKVRKQQAVSTGRDKQLFHAMGSSELWIQSEEILQ